MGRLVLIATPVGNLEDLTPRAQRVLGEVDALACEDTRVTRRLFEHFQITSPRTVFAYHEHNEEQAGRRIMGLLEEGLTVGVCSDGGYPGISDPGYRAIAAAVEAGHELEVIPGASAVPVALLLSGLPSSTYTFKGFPPRKSGARQRFLADDAEAPHTMVLFESPYRVGALLADALVALGDRRAAVCLELTKKFQRVHRGFLSDLAKEFDGKTIKGEATVVIAGRHAKFVRQSAEDETG
jgi:16S rRNA (cytidine1402-2'-O)-methyltransferase